MWPLALRLEAAGFRTARVGYPSRMLTVDQSVALVGRKIAVAARGWAWIDLVGHSLGGIIARRVAEDFAELPIRRIVQLGSPNAGSPVAGQLNRNRLAREFFGPVLEEIATLDPGRGRSRGVGAIAGTIAQGASIPVAGLQGPSDGLVEIGSALSGAEQEMVVPAAHGWLPLSATVSQQVISFLTDGSFKEDREREDVSDNT